MLQETEIQHGWVKASEAMVRYRKVFDAAKEKARSWCTEAQAEDQGQVSAWLDRMAQSRRLKVVRGTTDGGRIACHEVLILDEVEGELVHTECGGYVSMSELKRGAHGGTEWLHKMEDLGNGWVRIEVMITDCFPEHEMFKRADGSRMDLGFNDNEHFYSFLVEIHVEDVADTM